MYSEKFQSAYDAILSEGKQLLSFLRELREGRFKEGDNTSSLQSVENDIVKTLKALENQEYSVAVIAPMKAGKSTFINALIGSDLLASESAACTVCRTDIRHIKSGQPQLLEHQERQNEPIILAEGSSADIVERFLERTHQIREAANKDLVTHFEVLHSIDAIKKYSSLAGFKLVDTPGPNEWESATLNTAKLKQTALEAVRTCDAILFLLDYTSFKDEASTYLFRELIKNRQDFLLQNTGKIYFVLNKVDMKTEKDISIDKVIQALRLDLENFKFPNPVIYPVSARKGLWSKLILNDSATQQLKKDFRKFYSGAYAIEDEEGGSYTPPSSKIAPQALQDSQIPIIEEKVMQTIIQNSGWNLLSGVCAKLDKSAKSIEDKLNTEIRGWEMDLKNLQAKVEEYRQRAESAKKKFEDVRKAVDKRENELTIKFNAELENFSNTAKLRIDNQFNRLAESRKIKAPIADPILWVKQSMDSFVKSIIPSIFETDKTGSDPYKIQVYSQAEASNIAKAINSFCGPVIQDWWVDTQDRLIREGNLIQKELVNRIQTQTQQISDELSLYLKESLQVNLNPHPIQFPKFEFPSIDEQIQRQQEAYTRYKEQTKYKTETKYRTKQQWQKAGYCDTLGQYKNISIPYEKKVSYQETVGQTSYRDIFVLDLQQISKEVQLKIDVQVNNSQVMLGRVVHKQVIEYFKSAEQQIDNYIKRFQDDLEQLQKERISKETQAEAIREKLEEQKHILEVHLEELVNIRQSLNSWQPIQIAQ